MAVTAKRNARLLRAVCIAAGLASQPAMAAGVVPALTAEPCEWGAYQVKRGGWLVLNGNDSANGLAYARSDGEVGTLTGAGSSFAQSAPRSPLTVNFRNCQAGEIMVSQGGVVADAKRLILPARTVRFRSGEIELAGKLVMPPSGQANAIIVFVTGSDQTPEIGRTNWQYILPLQGVGVFVFDKRGTGLSKGEQTANFHLRANDVGAAVAEVRRLAGPRPKVGLFGVSQGGWVAPLAAKRSSAVDFVIVAYGMAEGVPAEDREEIVQNLRAAGFGDADVKQALRLQAAATRVVVSHWTSGWDEFDAVRTLYRDARWAGALGSDGYTALMMNTLTADLKRMGPRLDLGISFEYEPLPTIRSLSIPQLWILGGSDTSAPSTGTRAILTELQRAGHAIDLVNFPKADHGILERESVAGVLHVRTSSGYRELVAQWALNRRIPAMAHAIVQPRQRAKKH